MGTGDNKQAIQGNIDVIIYVYFILYMYIHIYTYVYIECCNM